MRRIRYSVAMSLDGYIAGPNGEADWITMDPEIDFRAMFGRYDTILLGRKTFEAAHGRGGGGGLSGMRTFVFSRTLRAKDHPKVTIVSDDARETLSALKEAPGKDIWLMGGGGLFRSLLDLDLVDTVEVGLIPVLLGKGIPFLPPTAESTRLKLAASKTYKKTGTVMLEYEISAR